MIRVVWMDSRNGVFSINSLYSIMERGMQFLSQRSLFGIHGSY